MYWALTMPVPRQTHLQYYHKAYQFQCTVHLEKRKTLGIGGMHTIFIV